MVGRLRELVGLWSEWRLVGNVPPFAVHRDDSNCRHSVSVGSRIRNCREPRLRRISRICQQGVGTSFDQFVTLPQRGQHFWIGQPDGGIDNDARDQGRPFGRRPGSKIGADDGGEGLGCHRFVSTQAEDRGQFFGDIDTGGVRVSNRQDEVGEVLVVEDPSDRGCIPEDGEQEIAGGEVVGVGGDGVGFVGELLYRPRVMAT